MSEIKHERVYYSIDESAAKTAHDMASFSDYEAGSKTAEYMKYADKAYDLADKIAAEKPERAADGYWLADKYAKRMAENINKDSRIGASCPSVMIAGPANFPTKKKEKQVAAWDKNQKEWAEIQGILRRMENILTGKEVIKSDDDNAVEKLTAKLEKLQEKQDLMKRANAYYRKHETCVGCDGLSEKLAEQLDEHAKGYGRPFEAWKLSNNNAEIKRVKGRIEQLEREQEREAEDIETDYFTVSENKELMRLQILFDGKPSEPVRSLLKANGFRWAPSQEAWQRQLTDNARYALKRIMNQLEELCEAEA